MHIYDGHTTSCNDGQLPDDQFAETLEQIMENEENVQIQLAPYEKPSLNKIFDLDRIIYDLNDQVDLLASQADRYDYVVSVASGVICGLLDILWVGEFSLEHGRGIASDRVDDFVKKTAKLLGHEGDSVKSAVKFLEDRFPIPSDGNTPDLGGGLQHHLRDFAHHPTIAGLVFSLLTQFTYKSYGTDTAGAFMVVDVPEASRIFIGNDVPSKVFHGTVIWFFHLVSDMAGSSASAGLSGGTGIPGPIISIAKELSALPVFKSIRIDDNSLSVFLSKLFNGTLFAKCDEAGKIIKESILKLDLRGEIGVGFGLGRQAVPVVANDCMVRAFYFIRRLAIEIRDNGAPALDDLRELDWDKTKPFGNPTISRMLTIATGVFTTIDVGEAVVTQKYWISVNYIGVGRFAVAIGEDVSFALKARNVKQIRQVYRKNKQFTYMKEDNSIYERMGEGMSDNKLGLTIEQTEILYNLEYYKILHDVDNTKAPINNEAIRSLKRQWADEWKEYMTKGFSSFLQSEGAELHWHSEQELLSRIAGNNPLDVWFRLVLLEAMLFEPYYPLGVEENKKGEEVPSKKYKDLDNPMNGFNQKTGDDFLETFFCDDYYKEGYVKRLRKSYNKAFRELKEVLKGALVALGIAAGSAVAVVASAGIFAGPIAVALVGSSFPGLAGIALTNACLAYIGGGAIAVGGLGIAGGTATIVGGGALLGTTVGLGIGGAVGAAGIIGKESTVQQSAKLLVSMKEVFLNDEKDVEYSDSVYEQYTQKIKDIQAALIEIRLLEEDEADPKRNKEIKRQIKNAEESIKAMIIARNSMKKFKSSFELGMDKAE